MTNKIKQLRINLANLIWPKEINVGDNFIVIARLDRTEDISWIGETFKCNRIIAGVITGSRYGRYENDYAKDVIFPPQLYKLKPIN